MEESAWKGELCLYLLQDTIFFANLLHYTAYFIIKMGSLKLSVLTFCTAVSGEGSFEIKPATELKQGSVMDILGGGPKSSPSSSVSQSAQKVNTTESSSAQPAKQPDLSTLFKKSGWTCDVCLVNNKEELEKCAACQSPKPGPQKPKGEHYFSLAIK